MFTFLGSQDGVQIMPGNCDRENAQETWVDGIGEQTLRGVTFDFIYISRYTYIYIYLDIHIYIYRYTYAHIFTYTSRWYSIIYIYRHRWSILLDYAVEINRPSAAPCRSPGSKRLGSWRSRRWKIVKSLDGRPSILGGYSTGISQI